MTAIRITGGTIQDPANNIDGEVRDLCLDDGKVVAEVGPDARRIDARGMVVMPGGVDIHAHIAGPKINAARRLSPDDRRDDPLDRTEVLRSGTGGLVPSTFATGYRYSLLGYTTVVEAAAPPLAARHVLAELRDTPMIDKAGAARGRPPPHPSPRATDARCRRTEPRRWCVRSRQGHPWRPARSGSNPRRCGSAPGRPRARAAYAVRSRPRGPRSAPSRTPTPSARS